jgi:hypothetical protein
MPVLDLAVARQALVAAYAHPTQAIPRPVTLFSNKWESEDHPEGKGELHFWSVTELGEWCAKQSRSVRKKNTGAFLAPGITSTGRRLMEACTAVGWAVYDADNVGDWLVLLAALDAADAAYVGYRSPSHNGRDKIKWRVWLPLALPFHPGGTHEWSALYHAARTALNVVSELSGDGFDASTDDVLNRFYPPYRIPENRHLPPHEVIVRQGKGLDLQALYHALGEHAPKSKRTTGTHRFVTSWNVDTHGAHPLFTALVNLGRVGKCCGTDLHGAKGQERTVEKYELLCPWGDQHTGGPQLNSSTAIWVDGSFDCKHAHCEGRTARDVAETLGIQLSPEEQATLDETRAIARVRAQLKDAPPPVTLEQVQDKANEALHTAESRAGLHVLRLPPGSGKTHAGIAFAVARDSKTVLLLPTHKLAREVKDKVEALGITPLYGRGILEVRTGHESEEDPGEPVCYRPKEVAILQARGISPRGPLCRGTHYGRTLGDPCPQLPSCEAAETFEGPEDAKIAIATYAYAPLLIRMFPDALFIVDETPSEPVERHELTPALIREALATIPNTRGARRGSTVRLVLGAILYLLESTAEGRDVAPILDAYFTTKEGGAALATFRSNFDLPKDTTPEHVWDLALETIQRMSAEGTGEPLLPSKPELVRLRLHKGDRKALRLTKNDAAAWKLIDAAARMGTSLYARRDGTTLHLILRSKVWHAISKLDHVVLMDGTADVATLELLVGKKAQVLECDVIDKANIVRIVRPTRHLNRSELCPDGVAKVTEHLRGAVRAAVAEIVARMAPHCSIVLSTYEPLSALFKTTWETGQGELAELLAPLRAHGATLHVTYWGASDVRGCNTHQGAHVSWGIGNPRMNVGVAGELIAALRGLAAPDEALTFEVVDAWAASEIAQFHERLRPVQREGETLLSIQEGEIVSSVRWYRQNVTVLEPAMGRPKTEAAMTAEEFVAIGKALGWARTRDAAAALGLGVATVSRYQTGKRAIPDDVAKRVRELASASSSVVPESGYQKKKGTLVSFTHFREQKNVNVYRELHEDYSSAKSPLEPVQLPLLTSSEIAVAVEQANAQSGGAYMPPPKRAPIPAAALHGRTSPAITIRGSDGTVRRRWHGGEALIPALGLPVALQRLSYGPDYLCPPHPPHGHPDVAVLARGGVMATGFH